MLKLYMNNMIRCNQLNVLKRLQLNRCYAITSKKKCVSSSSLISNINTVNNNGNNIDSNRKVIAYWLLGMSGLVACMVTIGGVTRLTKSGLSMTDWRIQGSLPPITNEEWDIEFARYKTYPEWQQRKSMTLDEFKFIYAWEYGHRMFGRFLGIAFAGPALVFAARGMIPRNLYPRLGTLFALGGTQGLIGWWMVKSGLNVDPEQKKEIRVSPYRLTTHLSMAFTTYSLLLWTSLDLLNTADNAKAVSKNLSLDILKKAKGLRGFALLNGALVFSTVMSGAFVAGNDAGNAFNTFPMMDGKWIPDEILDMQPVWRNFFENTATVQFDHRVLALSTLGSIWTMYYNARSAGSGALWKSIPSYTRLAFNATTGISLVQVGLGISTLLLYVPIPLAAVHQAGSLTLLTSVICLAHSLRFSKFAQVITKLK